MAKFLSNPSNITDVLKKDLVVSQMPFSQSYKSSLHNSSKPHFTSFQKLKPLDDLSQRNKSQLKDTSCQSPNLSSYLIPVDQLINNNNNQHLSKESMRINVGIKLQRVPQQMLQK